MAFVIFFNTLAALINFSSCCSTGFKVFGQFLQAVFGIS
jgi:hypothetical protein